MAEAARCIWFSGQVQGVGFRYTAQRIANRLGLTGYVRNLHDGRVEMLAQGQADAIDQCVADLGEVFGGYIRDVKMEEMPVNPRWESFEITF